MFGLPAWVVYAIGGVVTAVGAWVTWRGLVADRWRGVPRCPKCWYNMIGAEGLRCPECGHACRRARDLLRTRRRWRSVAAGGLMALALPAAWLGGNYGQWVLRRILPQWKVVERIELGRFVVERSLARWDDFHAGARVRVYGDGRLVSEMRGYILHVGDSSGPVVGRGEDLNGDGMPDLLIYEYTGGAHCCSNYYFYALDSEFGLRALDRIEAEHGDVRFADLDGDGTNEMTTQDWTFAYWHTSFAGSPAPEVVLRWRGGRCVVAPELMERPASDAAEFAGWVERTLTEEENAAAWSHGGVPVSYWATMLRLIYTGHGDVAERFADEAWPAERSGEEKAAFLAEFRSQLARSPYWRQLGRGDRGG